MFIQVGTLARSSGLTVRTLHHYDEIGLLQPSGRSDSGDRTYSEADVARLHSIQALRQLGLSPAEIGPLLEGGETSPERILDQQLLALEDQIRHATELKDRITFLRELLHKGEQPGADAWLQSLAAMTTYSRYFSLREIRTILEDFRKIETEWLQLLAEVRACMDSGAAADSETAQALTRRWMALMHRWMRGDFALLDRWGAMYKQEPAAHGLLGAPPADMIEYMERAVAVRVQLLQQHFGDVDFRPMRLVPDEDFEAIEKAGRKLLDGGKTPTEAASRKLRDRWHALLDEMAGGDATLRAKLLTMHQADPRLLAGAPLSRDVREFLMQVPQDA